MPEFTGVVRAQGFELFALADRTEGQAARWLKRGQEFEGYTILAYLSATETIVLQRGGESMQLRLRQSRVLPLAPDQAAMLRLARQELTKNEEWGGPIRFEGPHLFKGNWLVVARYGSAGQTETRIVIFTPAGSVQDYLRLSVRAAEVRSHD